MFAAGGPRTCLVRPQYHARKKECSSGTSRPRRKGRRDYRTLLPSTTPVAAEHNHAPPFSAWVGAFRLSAGASTRLEKCAFVDGGRAGPDDTIPDAPRARLVQVGVYVLTRRHGASPAWMRHQNAWRSRSIKVTNSVAKKALDYTLWAGLPTSLCKETCMLTCIPGDHGN